MVNCFTFVRRASTGPRPRLVSLSESPFMAELNGSHYYLKHEQECFEIFIVQDQKLKNIGRLS